MQARGVPGVFVSPRTYNTTMPKTESALSRESAIRRTAKHVLFGGLAILAMKFGIFWLTNSTAVLADAMESIVNLIAAIVMLYGIWMLQRPSDESRPTQHSKSQYMMIGFEGWLILIIGTIIGYISVNRLFTANDDTTPLELKNLQLGVWLTGGVALITSILAFYVLSAGKKRESQVLIADGKHLLADVASTVGVAVGLSIVNAHYPENKWIDPLVAIIVAAIVLYTSWRLMWKSVTGLTESYEQEIDPTIALSLDELVKLKSIAGYKDVRYRFNGPHRWIALTMLVDPSMSIGEGKKVSRKTAQHLKDELEDAKVEIQVEPYEGDWPPEAWIAADEAAALEEATSEAESETDTKTDTDGRDGDDEPDPTADSSTGDNAKHTGESDDADPSDATSDTDLDAQENEASSSTEDQSEPDQDSTDDPAKPETTSSDDDTENDADEPETHPWLNEPEKRFGDDIDDGDNLR